MSHILGSLLQQLLRRTKRMSNRVHALYERCNDGKRRPTSGELADLLHSESRFLPKLFIVVDALDECPSADDMTSRFLLEIQKLRPNLHLLITSRPHLKRVTEQLLPDAIRLEIRAHDEDIEKYLDEQFRKKLLSSLVTDNTEIAKKITEKAKGMYIPFP